ncbi:MAG: hypothetical protein Q9159_001635 [Coniocarpon cinnabarinum]
MEPTTQQTLAPLPNITWTRGPSLVKRVQLPPFNTSLAPPGLIEAVTKDPWSQADKYARGWLYFCVILLAFAIATRLYYLWSDKVRRAQHKAKATDMTASPYLDSPETPYEMANLYTDRSTNKLFPRVNPVQLPPEELAQESVISSFKPINDLIALFRYFFYRPTPVVKLHKRWRPISFPSLAVLPLYWQSIRFGSPPLAIRSGMIAVSMMPWLVALSMKTNLITLLTGIGHERLNVLHRWGGWLCLFLALVHTVPFYVTPIWDKGGYRVFHSYFNTGIYIYGTGWAALVPLIFLCVHSFPLFRHFMYELFVALHVPAAIVFLAMMFWHCNNYLTSWDYLFSTVAIWVVCLVARLFTLNWTNPFKMAWLIGDECAVYLMPENAIKITIPTQVRWKPGQYVYLRMPGISVFENHPFTVTSLCSEDFPSEYGEGYRDMVLLFRPFSGFTRKVLNSAIEKGPWHTYRAFIDGPYGGVKREISSFDHVVLIAGGSGITALISHLLDLIKHMRDGKAVTKRVQIIWALKRPETMEWFKEELRICREFAPPDSVTCQFYITAAKRLAATGQLVSAHTPSRPMGLNFHDKVNDTFQDIANKRHSHFSELSGGRTSALIAAEAQGDAEKEAELRREREDNLTALPKAHVVTQGAKVSSSPNAASPEMGQRPIPARTIAEKRRSQKLALDIQAAQNATAHPDTYFHKPVDITQQGAAVNDYTSSGGQHGQYSHPQPLSSSPPSQQQHTRFTDDEIQPAPVQAQNSNPYYDHRGPQNFDFGFPSTPTEFQKSLMRFAFLPASRGNRADGWSTEYGRPDLPFFLRRSLGKAAKVDAEGRGGEGMVGRRACVFVCGPPAMRVDVQKAVAELQSTVVKGSARDEIFMHAENYAL